MTKIVSRITLIGLSLGLIVGLTGGGIYLYSQILYGDHPYIAYVLGQIAILIGIVIATLNVINELIKSYKDNW